MKVAIGYRVQDGPWGGGNRFVAALVAALREAGHIATETLDGDDIDIVLMIDPRRRNPGVTFRPGAVQSYLKRGNPRAIVVHRINECDERKKTKTMNARLRLANATADHTIFIASWLKDLAVWRPRDGRGHSVILNGGDTATFHSGGYRHWDGREPLKLVTHHWGGNWMKGFDVYAKLDDMLVRDDWTGRLEFTYIGNLPSGFAFKNARHLPPMTGDDLAAALSAHHVYITGSINEPGGMHHIEGALCGLPILFRHSGALPEYCTGFGEMFEDADFEPALDRMMADYDRWSEALKSYPYSADRMVAAYIDRFEQLVADRDAVAAGRTFAPVAYFMNQIF